MNKVFVSILAVIANLILAIGKIVVGWISKSSAVLADGINSATDVVASIISFIGIKAAEKPADEKHPYGHGKAEVISGFVITLIIFVSGILILIEAVKGFINPELTSLSYLAIGVMGFSALTNFVMSSIKIKYGKKYNSVSLISDGIHSRIDLLVSLGVFVGLFFVNFYSKLDSILALLIGIYIIKESITLGRETIDELLGTKADKETEEKIKEIIKQNKIELSELKTQKRGSNVSANIEIKLDKNIKVNKATKISENLKKELEEKINELNYVAIQIKSHEISQSFYKPSFGFGKSYNWKRKGTGGYCVCEKCNYKIKHERGKPCYKIKCPKCEGDMKRE